jgi:succinate dehydrogenase/fumarate reductase cytochrome b subunit
MLGAAALARAIEMFKDGASPQQPIFPIFLLVFGIAMFYWGVNGVRALRGRHGPEDEKLIASEVAEVDRRAPSGLKPLWIGLAVVVGIFLIWVVIAGFFAT